MMSTAQPSSAALLLAAPIAVPLAAAACYSVPALAPLVRKAATPARTAGLVDDTAARASRRWTAWAGLASPTAILAAGAALAVFVPAGGPVTAARGLLRADALTVWMLLVVGAVALLACAATPAYLAHEREAGHGDDRTARRYQMLVHAFLAAMCAALLSANLGVLWAAIEATTVVTAFLVGHRRTRASVEAAWKYVVICSAGIALAFLGVVLLSYAARAAGIPESAALDWPTLVAHARHLDPAVVRLATVLIVLGFGAKAGLVPLHAWLPDAHSQAAAPVSALMSGVLLSVSFSAVWRGKVIADSTLGAGFTRTLLTGIALLTLATAVALLLGQRNYKRLLAYSSMEHMSVIALGAAVGTPLAAAAVLLHIAGHGLAKTVAFCASGHLLHLERTTRIDRVRGLLARAPGLATAFGLALLALLGLPPFSLFASEVAVVRAGFLAGMGWTTALVLVLLVTAFSALALHTSRMLLGPTPGARIPAPVAPEPEAVPAGAPATTTVPRQPATQSRSAAGTTPPQPVPPVEPSPHRLGAAAGTPLALGLLACAALGITTGPLHHLLTTAAALLEGH